MLVDSHTHLNFPELKIDLENKLSLMKDHDVRYALCISTRPDNIQEVVDIASSHSNLFASIGIHPDEDVLGSINEFKDLVSNKKVIAIGETGLDYYRLSDDVATASNQKLIQQKRFSEHIELAHSTNLPLVIHCREAFLDTYNLLNDYKPQGLAVMHCWTKSIEATRKFLDLGYYISLSGIVTFSKATNCHDLARFVPLDRLLVETDAPFLAPEPFRGKTNHPALVKYTAQRIADLRGISFEEVASNTTDNFFKLFKKAYK